MSDKHRSLLCPCKQCCGQKSYSHAPDIKTIRRLERKLKLKEAELLCMDKELQKKIKKLELQSKSNAIIKLKEAERKLVTVTKAVEKCKKYEKRNKNKKKQKRETANVLHNFFDKVINMDKDCNRIAKVNKYDLLANMRRIFQPAPINTGRVSNHSRYNGLSRSERKWNASARDCYLMSLQRTPQLWINHRWPQFYPQYLSARAQWKNFRVFLLFLLGILFWVPALLCLEICKCCFCSCCCD